MAEEAELAARTGGFKAFKSQVFAAIPALLMPLFVIGTLRFGIATPTEASGMAVAYALFVSGFVYRDLTLRGIWSAVTETGFAWVRPRL